MSEGPQGSQGEEVQRVLDALTKAVDVLAALDDPADRARGAGLLLNSWPEQNARLRALRQEAVVAMRNQKISYRNIAKSLGISLARVQQIEVGETGREGRAPAKE
ncbi:hypothetical protein AB0N93_15350 [Streptomyces sp. NPDC091267]|uniref:hypothetical protein n=1 Tax=Streptomyces sp. NPDC091267 TaxID=3155195 RepID=UPI00343AE45A